MKFPKIWYRKTKLWKILEIVQKNWMIKSKKHQIRALEVGKVHEGERMFQAKFFPGTPKLSN